MRYLHSCLFCHITSLFSDLGKTQVKINLSARSPLYTF